MTQCEPRGFKVKVEDAKRAAEFAIEISNKHRELMLQDEIKKVTKRWLFRDRTTEEAKAYLIKYYGGWAFWEDKNWGITGWAKNILQASSIVDDEHIWVNSEDASTISAWLNQNKVISA